MTEALIVFCTCGSKEEAERLANTVVEERLAACVNVLPAMESIYRWQGAVERAGEILLLIKTTADRFSALRERIHSVHSYDTPEVIAVRVADGSERYLAWIGAQV